MHFGLAELTVEFASALKAVDARNPQAQSIRSKKCYKPGIGPHSESAAISLILREMAVKQNKYNQYVTSVRYPGTKQKCDICFGNASAWEWAIEVKLLRLMGDNNKTNDHMLMHLLSPYADHRSALTDLEKLCKWNEPKHKAIMIYGFDYKRWPLEPAVAAFETLARSRVRLSERFSCSFADLIHPVHTAGAVIAWEILPELP